MKRDLNELYYILDRITQSNTEPEYLAEEHDNSEYHLYYELYSQALELKSTMKYLNTPIKYHSELRMSSSGRYETTQGDYFTSGSKIEFELDDQWHVSRVEFNGEYYIYQYKDVEMSGLKVRVR